MALPEHLIEKLACVKCQGDLSYDTDKDYLTCQKCSLGYRVEDNVAVLLMDEAERIG